MIGIRASRDGGQDARLERQQQGGGSETPVAAGCSPQLLPAAHLQLLVRICRAPARLDQRPETGVVLHSAAGGKERAGCRHGGTVRRQRHPNERQQQAAAAAAAGGSDVSGGRAWAACQVVDVGVRLPPAQVVSQHSIRGVQHRSRIKPGEGRQAVVKHSCACDGPRGRPRAPAHSRAPRDGPPLPVALPHMGADASGVAGKCSGQRRT